MDGDLDGALAHSQLLSHRDVTGQVATVGEVRQQRVRDDSLSVALIFVAQPLQRSIEGYRRPATIENAFGCVVRVRLYPAAAFRLIEVERETQVLSTTLQAGRTLVFVDDVSLERGE